MAIDPGVDADFRDMVRTLFDREYGPNGRRAVSEGFDASFWTQLEEAGLALLTTSEAQGGSGASWAEAATLHHALGYYGVDVPLAEHDLLGGWLAERADLPPVEGLTTVGFVSGIDASSDSFVVPFASVAERVLLVVRNANGCALRDLDRSAFELVESTRKIDPTRDSIRVSNGPEIPIDDALARELMARGALARSLQICGALARSVDYAVEHAHVRVQFGRPLMKFQAVQALLADAAAESALASAATGAAIAEWQSRGEFDEIVERTVAVAKSTASNAVETVTRNSHQVLGAMGTTREHALQRVTVPLLRRKYEFGSAREWNRYLAKSATELSDGGVWEWITAVR